RRQRRLRGRRQRARRPRVLLVLHLRRQRAQLVGHFQRRGRPLVGLLAEQPRDDRLQLGQLAARVGQRERRVLAVGAQQLGGGGPGDGQPPGQGLVEDDAQRVELGAR